jgi:hypothetical protein
MEHLIEDSVEKKYSIILIVLCSIEEIAKIFSIKKERKDIEILFEGVMVHSGITI